jgi:FMN hydrolase / 5-amino-6-(5-phospho-D-ribitylamino)uracil phosphatase
MPSNVHKHIITITFDGDATLWDFEAVMRHALARALERLRARRPGPATAALTVDRMIEIRNQVAADLTPQGARLEDIRYHAFIRTVAAVGGDDPALAAELATLYHGHRAANIVLYPAVLDVLDALVGRYTLGLLSNGNTDPASCGLAGVFDAVIFADDVGVAKPDPAIFRRACERLGCRPAALLHVGDSLASDVRGAHSVGAAAAWLNRDRHPNPTAIVPEYEIHTLTDLLPILL